MTCMRVSRIRDNRPLSVTFRPRKPPLPQTHTHAYVYVSVRQANFRENGDIRMLLLCSRLPCLQGHLVSFCRRSSTLRERTSQQYRPVRRGCHKRWSDNRASTSKSVSCLLSILETRWNDSLSSYWWTKIFS